ncbi:hypothetical protein CUMW_197290 [Citrus unshiu]|nr:hypothetical protein CUMW_197290 [Citrus unshiu]
MDMKGVKLACCILLSPLSLGKENRNHTEMKLMYSLWIILTMFNEYSGDGISFKIDHLIFEKRRCRACGEASEKSIADLNTQG